MNNLNLKSYHEFHNYIENRRGFSNGQIILKLTNLCDGGCSYCYNKDRICETLEMNMDIAIQGILKIGPAFKNLTLNLTGGDLNLYNRDKLKQLMDFIKKYIESVKHYQNVNIVFHPNTVNSDNEITKYIKDFACGVGFSYDGLCNSTNRNCDSNIAIEKMKELDDKHIGYNILSVLTKETINNIDNELLHMDQFSKYFFHNPPTDHHLNDDLKLDKTDFATFYIKKLNYLLKSDKKTNEYCGDILRYIDPFIGKNDCTTGLCRLLSNLYVIEPNGDIMGCPLRTEDIFTYCNINNINNIYDIYESNGYLNFEKLYYDRLVKCKDCNSFKYCHSGCIRGLVTKDFLGKDSYCKDIQIIVKYIQLMIDNNIEINDNITQFSKIYKEIIKKKNNK